MKNFAVAVDGPAGTGKSSVVKLVAKRFGLNYIDTGAMYRTVALKAIRCELDTSNGAQVNSILGDLNMEVTFDEDGQVVLLDGENVNDKIRTPEVTMGSSNVATIPEVRVKLAHMQRELSNKFDVIMDGRDIGTYVLPNAQVKIFLTASVEERAKRRYNEMVQKGYTSSVEEVKREMEIRDNQDSNRQFAPLKAAEDAVVIDTTNLMIEEVVAKISELIEAKINI